MWIVGATGKMDMKRYDASIVAGAVHTNIYTNAFHIIVYIVVYAACMDERAHAIYNLKCPARNVRLQ